MTDREIPKTKHKISEAKGGNSWESWIQAVCTCGWKGRQRSCHSNWQMHDVSEDKQRHRFDVVHGRVT